MERTLVDSGSILMKFFIHITKSEQLRRFERRAADPYKHWKISEEDWRNRRKWNEHLEAAEEMFVRTSPRIAPWNLIEGNFKWFARIKVMKLLVKRLEQEFGEL
jgi:polyphosphate kinase 2 (PPK2 family)